MAAIEKKFIILTDPKRRAMPHYERECTPCMHNGRHWGQSGSRGKRKTLGKGLCCGFRGKEWERQNKQA